MCVCASVLLYCSIICLFSVSTVLDMLVVSWADRILVCGVCILEGIRLLKDCLSRPEEGASRGGALEARYASLGLLWDGRQSE